MYFIRVILYFTREFSWLPMGSLLQNASFASLTLRSSRLYHNIATPNSPQTGRAVAVVILHLTRKFSWILMGSLLQNASFASQAGTRQDWHAGARPLHVYATRCSCGHQHNAEGPPLEATCVAIIRGHCQKQSESIQRHAERAAAGCL